jgi:hypothetical protein
VFNIFGRAVTGISNEMEFPSSGMTPPEPEKVCA